MSRAITRFTLIDSLVDALERRILSGDYPTGTRLPSEAEIANDYEVSRPVVREALARMRERGYLETINGRGTFVCEPDVDAISQSMLRHIQIHSGTEHTVDQLYEARSLIETHASGLAAERATAADIAGLEQQLEIMRGSVDDPQRYTAADIGFHLAIAEATQNPLFSILESPLIELIVRGMFETVSATQAGMLSGIDEHGRILERLIAHDIEGARAEMAAHLERSRLLFAQNRERQPGANQLS